MDWVYIKLKTFGRFSIRENSKMPEVTDGTLNASNDVRCSGVGAVMLPVDVDSLTAFDLKGDANGISQQWKQSFGLYLRGKGVTDDGQKRALLLHAAGVDVQEIYFTLANEEESSSFTKTVKVLDDYFVPKSNVPFERHLFRQIANASDETVDQFVLKP